MDGKDELGEVLHKFALEVIRLHGSEGYAKLKTETVQDIARYTELECEKAYRRGVETAVRTHRKQYPNCPPTLNKSVKEKEDEKRNQ